MPEAEMLDLSICIVSHGHRREVERYLPQLFHSETRASMEVLLIDNTPIDATADWVAQRWPTVRVIRNERPQSYAENINLGLRVANRGRYFVALNPDVGVYPQSLDAAIHFLDSHPDVGMLGPKLLNPDGSLQPSCRAFSTPAVILIRGLHLDRFFERSSALRRYLMSDWDHLTSADVDWVTGAFMVVRREAIAAVGGMDERYRVAYSEDQDWCCRMWQAGWRVCYFPGAQAIHDHQRSGMRNPFSKMGFAQLINALRMLHKFGWRLSRLPANR
jgi:GT2 family glycosyltransferase